MDALWNTVIYLSNCMFLLASVPVEAFMEIGLIPRLTMLKLRLFDYSRCLWVFYSFVYSFLRLFFLGWFLDVHNFFFQMLVAFHREWSVKSDKRGKKVLRFQWKVPHFFFLSHKFERRKTTTNSLTFKKCRTMNYLYPIRLVVIEFGYYCLARLTRWCT